MVTIAVRDHHGENLWTAIEIGEGDVDDVTILLDAAASEAKTLADGASET